MFISKDTCTVETNGLGTIVVVDELTDERREQGYIQWEELYFKPGNGVTLDFEVVTRSYDFSDSSGRSVSSDTHVHSISDPMIGSGNGSLQGTFFVGRNIEHRDVDGDDSGKYLTSEEIQIIGKKDAFRLEVLGPPECQSNIHYCMTREHWDIILFDDDYEREDYEPAELEAAIEETKNRNKTYLFIWGKTDAPHKYTNLVMFNQPYDFDAWYLPQKYCYIWKFNVNSSNDLESSQFIQWHDKSEKTQFYHQEESNAATGVALKYSYLSPEEQEDENGGETSETGETGETSETNANEDETNNRYHPKKILLYADSYFVYVMPGRYYKCFNEEEQKQYYSDGKYGVCTPYPEFSQNTSMLSSMSLADLSMQEDAPHEGPDEPDGTHRWTKLLQHYWSVYYDANDTESLNKFLSCCFPIYIKYDNKTFNVNVSSRYARFTGYWLVMDRKNYVVKNNLSSLGVSNKLMMPIFKPYAECDLLGLSHDQAAFSGLDADYFINGLKSRYNEYSKHWKFQDNYSREETIRIFQEYCKTASPFKWELYFLHGGKDEYDEDTWNQLSDEEKEHSWITGRIVFRDPRLVGRGLTISGESLRRKHNASRYWNPNALSLGLVCQSCFSGGVKPGLKRPILSNHLNKDITEFGSDVFYYIAACETHPGWQDVSFTALKKIMARPGKTYQKISQEHNNMVNRYISVVCNAHLEFFNRNYELMYSLLPTMEMRELWDNTKYQIQQDLANNGEKYLCVSPWNWVEVETGDYEITPEGNEFPIKKMVPTNNYLASDNYFDPTTKKYHVTDSFYGVIRKEFYEDEFNEIYPNGKPYEIFGRTELSEDASWLSNSSRFSWMSRKSYSYRKNSLNRKLTTLKDEITEKTKEIFHSDIDERSVSIFTHPIANATGRFKTSTIGFPCNPNQQMDNYLRNDKDLERLSMQPSI